jgi:hydrogenase maturation protease
VSGAKQQPVDGEPGDRPRPCIVVAGLGTEYRRDDGVGPVIAARTVVQVPETRDIGPIVDPLDLLGRWDGADLAIVIDALCSGSIPGSVRVVDLTAKGASTSTTSTHGINLSGVLRLARVVDQAPARVIVVGIEGTDFGKGTGFSPAVDAAIPEAVGVVVDLIKEVYACA